MTSLRLPDVQLFFDSILDTDTPSAHEKTDVRTIKEWTEHVVKRQKEKIRYTTEKKLVLYSSDLLATAIRSGAWSPQIKEWLEEEVLSITSLPTKVRIQKKLEKIGYRFPEKGAQKIHDAARVLIDEFDGEWKKYFAKARNFPYSDDPFLEIKNVKRKTRDLALGNFILTYPTIDVHVARVLRRTGLVCHCYDFGLELKTSQIDGYDELSQLCVKLSEQLSVFPAQLDRALWHFGRSICSSTPKCDRCPSKSICLYYSYLGKNR